MKRPREILTCADLVGGETVLLDLGLVRATSWVLLGDRRARLLHDDLIEKSRADVWLKPGWRVLKVIERDAPVVVSGGEVDPLACLP